MIDGNVFWEYNYRVTNQAIFCPFKNIMGATTNKKNICHSTNHPIIGGSSHLVSGL